MCRLATENDIVAGSRLEREVSGYEPDVLPLHYPASCDAVSGPTIYRLVLTQKLTCANKKFKKICGRRMAELTWLVAASVGIGLFS